MELPTGHVLGVLAALGSALGWAVGAILFRRIGDRASPTATNLAKGTLGVGLLGLGLLLAGWTPVPPAQLVALTLSGLFGIAVGDTLFFAALVRLDPRATLLLATVGYVFTAVLAVVWLGERPAPPAWIGVVLVLAGVTAASWEDGRGGTPHPERRHGMVYGVLSAFATSASLVLAKTALDAVPTLQATWIRLVAGVAGVAAWTAATGTLRADARVFRDVALLRSLVLAVTVVMFGGFWLSLVALRSTWTAVATALCGMEPIFVIPLAWWLLGDRPRAVGVVGAVVAVGGVVVLSVYGGG